jgi:microcystin-dependent protein
MNKTILAAGQFIDSNGAPLAGGSVTFYVPGTTTAKDTWQDGGQTVLNTNPVTLDSLGSALIYGSGSYRQVVRDINGNIIWDQLTSDTAASASLSQWAGTSGGTANAQTVVSPNFSSTDGQVITFRAGFSNTGAMTLNASGAGPIVVLKDTSLGPLPVSSGDIVAGNVVDVTYVSADGSFHTSVSGGGGNATPTGALIDFAGASPPAGWLLCYGQQVSRTTYSTLFAVIGTQYGAGDGSTTFNVPDMRGRVAAGLDAGSGRLPGFTALGVTGGAYSTPILTANLPPYTPTGTVSVAAWNDVYNVPLVSNFGVGPPLSAISYGSGTTTTTPNSTTATFAGVPQGGTNTELIIVQPTISLNKIIKF